MSSPPPIDFLTRCAALRHRGLSVELMHDLQDAGNVRVLERLEAAADADLVGMSALDAEMRAAAVDLARAAGETGYVVWSRRSTGEVVAVAELGEPEPTPPRPGLGFRAPLRWEGDQA